MVTHATNASATEGGLWTPSGDDLARLQKIRGGALVTISLDTTPGQRLTVGERKRLDQLLAEAHRRVAIEPGDEPMAPPPNAEQLFAWLERDHMGKGLVIFSGAGILEAYRLPTAPRDVVVVDPTFATRELARALWQSPEILLLVLAASEARLFVTSLDVPGPVLGAGFPVLADRVADRTTRQRDDARGRNASTTDRFFRQVDQLLQPLAIDRPVVLFAAEPAASRFRAISSVPFLGVVHGNRLTTAPVDLWQLTQPLRHEHLDIRRQEGLARLQAAMASSTASTGVTETWTAAAAGQVDTLLVDPSFRWPGRTELGVALPEADPTAPGVIDDVVDDLIESVALSGGSVCFVSPGDLGRDGVAALLRWR